MTATATTTREKATAAAAAKAKNINNLNGESMKGRLSYMVEKTKTYAAQVAALHVSISQGNKKLGGIHSVSLRPVLDCINCKACRGKCYDIKTDCRRSVVMDSRAKNAAILKADPKRYFREVSAACQTLAFFRWHVGGDIVSRSYFDSMVKVAKENKHCRFLTYTKSFGIVNGYLDEGKKLPSNLVVIFSAWEGMEMPNPHHLPESHLVKPNGETTNTNAAVHVCPNDCGKCIAARRGCWFLKKNQSVLFAAH